MCSPAGLQTSLWRGCPIRTLRAHRSHAAPPERFAGLRVLRRPSAPRHPPRTRHACALLAWVVLTSLTPSLTLVPHAHTSSHPGPRTSSRSSASLLSSCLGNI